MAEVTAMRNNALPYPVYGLPYVVAFPILDADGDLVTGASGLDSEISKNGDTFADCTNEATEIATSSGTYYLSLTGTELTADVVTIIVKTSTSGGKTTTLTLYPRKLVSLRTGTCQGGAAGYMTLDASAGAADDLWNGCIVAGVLDSATEVRVITDYTGSNQQAAVTPNWNTTPDSDDTFTIYLPEGRQLPQANLTHIAGASVSTSTAQLGVNVVNFGGSAGTFASGRPEVNTTHAAGVAWASGAIVAGAFANNSIAATAIAADAIGASELAADAIAEIVAAVRVELATELARIDAAISSRLASASYTAPLDASGTRSAVGLASANLDTQLSTIDDFLDTEIAAIKAKTDLIPASPAATGDIATALNTYDGPTKAEMDAALAAGVALSPDAVNATSLAASATAEIIAAMSIGAPGGVAGQNTAAATGTSVTNLHNKVDVIDGIADAILALVGTDGVILAASMMNKIADHVLRRSQANVQASSDGDSISLPSLFGLIQSAQNSDTTTNPGKLTTFDTEGNELGQRTLTTDPAAEPITGIQQ